ncbi:MAG: hydrogenase expression/formation protein HypE [Desulfobacteraceae bacterium]|nr:MAG: hydrogenase expression/formation protein HypE [Desulfobacteraceae bacterium]
MDDRILLAHGSGGRLSHDLIREHLVKSFSNPVLNKLDDSAVFDLRGRVAFTTDSYVVSPIFFPGGDIGKLAVCGTVNDLSMSGAVPMYLALSLILEEGFPLSDLDTILQSIEKTSREAGAFIVTGDTKVVNKGSADKIFITTSGVGLVPEKVDISSANCKPGDRILLSGTIGDHGIALLSRREGIRFETSLQSDCAPLNRLVQEMVASSGRIKALRDPTRGGLAATLNEFAENSRVGIRIHEESIPVHPEVNAACELMGFDPLYVANEGKLVAVVSAEDADRLVQVMQKNRYAEKASVIGEVTSEHPGKVVMKTTLGTTRIVDMITGELLPRIC